MFPIFSAVHGGGALRLVVVLFSRPRRGACTGPRRFGEAGEARHSSTMQESSHAMEVQVCCQHITQYQSMRKEKSPCRQRKAKNLDRAVWITRYRQGYKDPEVAQMISNKPRAYRRMGNLDRVCAYAACSRWWLHAKPSLQQPMRCISRIDFGHRRTDCYDSAFHTRLAGYCVLFARDGRLPTHY